MGTKDHYVSQFHLRQFTDPTSEGQSDPWLWQGRISDAQVKRRAPKNIGYKSSMFDGPGGLADPAAKLEKYLAENVEAPAASAMREICQRPSGSVGELPPALMRYLAWAAARSLPMKTLFDFWANQQAEAGDVEIVEPPPEGLMDCTDRKRSISMKHPGLGSRKFSPEADNDQLAKQGWVIDHDDPDNLLEGIHIQAYYFQVRWFPRFRWYTLHAPKGQFFVIADRAVGWAADGFIEAPPSCLRDPSAYVLAPVSRELILMGRHTTGNLNVTPGHINTIIACSAHDWIAGPTKQTVEDALSARRFSLR
jgi:hypothetical protein